MKKSRFTEEKIIEILKLHAAGKKVGELCRQSGISQATLYNWKAKYGAMTVSEARTWLSSCTISRLTSARRFLAS